MLGLAGCMPESTLAHITGGFSGTSFERGHALRDLLKGGGNWPTPTSVFRTEVLIAGGGVAGLAAARALRLRGVQDFAMLELEDSAGGNARGGALNGIDCPLGAHYLPVPGDDAPQVQDLLEELGLRQRVAGRWVVDERHLCHSPQERLFFNDQWQDGLLPLQGVERETLAQYQKFAALVEQERKVGRWTIPVRNSALTPAQKALAAIHFVAYLDRHGLADPHLRWYLDYCCRDDYGAGIATVSAFAGVHYFASRHGFHAPGSEGTEREAVLTWPQGNAWLTQQLSAPLGERLHTGRVVLRIANTQRGVEVDALNTATQTLERWQARTAVVALPLHVAARVVQNPPDFLTGAAQRVVHAPWLVANLHLREPLHDRPGAAPSWDNVIYGDSVSTPGLGYVDARHQSLQSVPGATVLTYYRALGDVAGGALAGRQLLLHKPWAAWRNEIIAELAMAHPDLAGKVTQLEITRYGHAMAVPVPISEGQMGLQRSSSKRKKLSNKEHFSKEPPLAWEHLRFAHSDWAGYSIFEEAFAAGHAAGG
jgi:predicted NAD/FAD-dependent oxidoreductase